MIFKFPFYSIVLGIILSLHNVVNAKFELDNGEKLKPLSNLEAQRILFKQAEASLKSRKLDDFRNQFAQLSTYPIQGYLDYDYFVNNIHKASKRHVRKFLDQYSEYPTAYHLNGKWLRFQAKHKNWKTFLEFYDGRGNTTLKCLSFQAKIALKQTDGLLKEITPVWLKGKSQPKACDKPFQYFVKNETNVSKLIWLRIEKAFKANKTSLARYLARKLDAKQQNIVSTWYQAHRRPESHLKKSLRIKDNEINRKILTHSFIRLARRNASNAHKQWLRYKSKFQFSSQQLSKIEKKIALSAAYQYLPQAKQWLSELPDYLKTDKTDKWLARIHLRDQDWSGLIKTINSMSSSLQESNEWQYWLARSFESIGQQSKANKEFEKIAQKGSYYGFLAADKIKQNYVINQQNAVSELDEQSLLKNNKHLLRARELYYVGRLLDARREWSKGVKALAIPKIKQAAALASKWQWHDNAIKTVAKTPHRQDYNLRFPMPYKNIVMEHALTKKLDPSLIYGVIRRESLFDPKANSPVGAMGLMQLMPRTAKQTAKSLGIKRLKTKDIYDIKNNINFGTQYFKKVLNRFDNNPTLAAAAYNAGPHRVKKWLPKAKSMDADLWVETIPYNETRNYVQAVLAYSSIFDKSLGNIEKISNRMKSVKHQY